MKVLLKWKTVWRLQDIEKLHGQNWKTASQIYEQTLIIFMSGHVAAENLANMTKWFFWLGKKEESSSKLIIPCRENCFVALNTVFITKKCNNQRKLYEHLKPVMHMGNIRKSFFDHLHSFTGCSVFPISITWVGSGHSTLWGWMTRRGWGRMNVFKPSFIHKSTSENGCSENESK